MTFVSAKGRHQEGSFVFASRPKPIGSRSKFREPQENVCENIMFDRRVVRGNTYAQHIIPIPKPEIQRPKKIGKRSTASKRGREPYRPETPEPVPGRAHAELQTDLYLEELSEAIVTSDVCCQTDPALDRPLTPLFVPAKSGVDTDTQIEEGELFDFDREVQPVLEVLVGKTIEQSLLEVMEEEELACLRAQQRAFLELRNNEMAEVQRLQEKDRRLREEKERRIAQQREVLKKEKETAEKVAARAYTQSYLAGLLPAVYSSLTSHGYFYNPMERDLDINFFPWLLEEVHKRLEKRQIARHMLDTLIHNATQKRLERFRLI